MTNALSGPDFGDVAGLGRLAGQLVAAGDDAGHHTVRVANTLSSLMGEVVGPELSAVKAFSTKWDNVGGSLQSLSGVADSVAAAIRTLATRLDTAAQEWQSAVSTASDAGYLLEAIGLVASVTPPALAATATPDQVTAADDRGRHPYPGRSERPR